MKKTLLCFTFLLFVATSFFAQSESLHSTYDTILKNYVIDGLVDYPSLKENREALDSYLQNLAKITEAEFNTWNENEQLAYLINLYNADTLQLIIDNYPVDSIRDIGNIFRGPWDQKVVSLFGEMITLDNLEHDIIRVDYDEPRIHMVLVCAAIGCPPLVSEAYEGRTLIEQMDTQSHAYLHSEKGFVLDREKGTVYLSSIFKWYGDDFDSVKGFAEQYSGEDLEGLSIKWLDYDWSLNELR